MDVTLTCPSCRARGPLKRGEDGASLVCGSCGARYAVIDGIPMMLAPTHGHGSLAPAHKESQARFTDEEADAEWEINRPHGAPALYSWLLEEKFRLSVRGLRALPRGSTVLTVCGGSGLDAEFLARRGFHVVSTDISLEAARRVRERARRFGVEITPVVADVESLPFPDRSFDVVYVHDGLHHLEDPAVGLLEMARVAAWGISVNEPARAAVTALAVRLGLALELEEAGNRVARLTIAEVRELLAGNGFRTVEARRFAMYYKHVPGPAMRALSHGVALWAAKAAITIFNRVLGGLGNKLSVQAVREPHSVSAGDGDGRQPQLRSDVGGSL
jgi:SAM-dependent methyltransferase